VTEFDEPWNTPDSLLCEAVITLKASYVNRTSDAAERSGFQKLFCVHARLEKAPLGAYLKGMTQGEVVHLMTTAAKLLAQKRQLIERLHEDPGPEEREQIEQLLAKINRALDLLDGAGASGSD
jgi:DNA-binding MarR family transcriptional regulator